MSLRDGVCGLAAAGALTALATGLAHGAEPEPWQIGFQPAATPVMETISGFNDLLFVIITAIASFVAALLVFVLWRYRAGRNPEPSRTSHNTVIEVIWTVVPIMILIVIAIPSFKLLYYMDRTHEAELTVKAVGHQWYWTYEYPDEGIIFDSLLVQADALEPGEPRLLESEPHVVIPVDTTVRILATASDVIHSWAMPAFGVKIDATPGRLNETWLRVDEVGTYYGQCSELCGVYHGYMPITVEVVSKEAYAAWLEQAKEEYARLEQPAEAAVARLGAESSY